MPTENKCSYLTPVQRQLGIQAKGTQELHPRSQAMQFFGQSLNFSIQQPKMEKKKYFLFINLNEDLLI